MNKVKPILLGMCLTTLVGCTSISLKDMFEQPVLDFSHYFRWLFANFRERFLSS